MKDIIIKTIARQPDNTYKVSFAVTFADQSYFSGHVFVAEEDYDEMTTSALRRKITQTFIENLGGTYE